MMSAEMRILLSLITQSKNKLNLKRYQKNLNPLTFNYNNYRLLCHLFVILKVIFDNSVDPDQEQSDQGPHCLPVCKNWFEMFASIFSRRHKQTTAGFLGISTVKIWTQFFKASLASILSAGTSLLTDKEAFLKR